MRRPEALSARGAISSILEDACDGIAVIESDGRGLSVHVARTDTGAAGVNPAICEGGGISTASDGGQGPTQLGHFRDRVGADTQAGLGILLAGRRATVQGEAGVAGASGIEPEDPTRRVGILLDDDKDVLTTAPELPRHRNRP